MKLKHYILTLLTLGFTAGTLSANPADLNKDKRISWEEFEAVKKKDAKKNGKEYNEQQTKYLFEDKDFDGDGFLSYKEFGSHPVDLDGDKKISYEEFAKMHKKRGERTGRQPKEAWIKEMFAKKDKNGDGTLTYQELAAPVD